MIDKRSWLSRALCSVPPGASDRLILLVVAPAQTVLGPPGPGRSSNFCFGSPRREAHSTAAVVPPVVNLSLSVDIMRAGACIVRAYAACKHQGGR